LEGGVRGGKKAVDVSGGVVRKGRIAFQLKAGGDISGERKGL